jgi:thiol-disulfide isomerase/thioredoxin
MTQGSKWRIWIALALVLAAVAACQGSPQNTPTASATVQPVEEFTEETLAQYQGKIVLLNFWATTCVPCRKEMPELEAIYRKYRDHGVVVLGLSASDSSEDITAFANELGLTFPILRDSQRKASDAYEVRFLPTSVLLNRNGQVVTRKVGVIDKVAMSGQIERLFN